MLTPALVRLDALLTQFVDIHFVPPAMRGIKHPVLVDGENFPLCVYDAEDVTKGLPSWVDLSRLEDVVFEGGMDRKVAEANAAETREFLRGLGWRQRANALIS